SALQSLAATCPGIDRILATGDPFPRFDAHAALLSLPGIFGTNLGSIPSTIPYLSANPERVQHWRKELASESRRKVGIVWQGSPTFQMDHVRSARLAEFAPLADAEGTALFSLQVGAGSDQLASVPFPVIDLGRRFDRTSLDDLAAVLVNLDL